MAAARGLTPFYRSCTWSGPAIGFTQSRPSLMLQTSRVSRAKFLEGDQGHALIAGLGGPAYELMDGNIVLAWRDGVALMFELVQAQTTPQIDAHHHRPSAREAVARQPPGSPRRGNWQDHAGQHERDCQRSETTPARNWNGRGPGNTKAPATRTVPCEQKRCQARGRNCRTRLKRRCPLETSLLEAMSPRLSEPGISTRVSVCCPF